MFNVLHITQTSGSCINRFYRKSFCSYLKHFNVSLKAFRVLCYVHSYLFIIRKFFSQNCRLINNSQRAFSRKKRRKLQNAFIFFHKLQCHFLFYKCFKIFIYVAFHQFTKCIRFNCTLEINKSLFDLNYTKRNRNILKSKIKLCVELHYRNKLNVCRIFLKNVIKTFAARKKDYFNW